MTFSLESYQRAKIPLLHWLWLWALHPMTFSFQNSSIYHPLSTGKWISKLQEVCYLLCLPLFLLKAYCYLAVLGWTNFHTFFCQPNLWVAFLFLTFSFSTDFLDLSSCLYFFTLVWNCMEADFSSFEALTSYYYTLVAEFTEEFLVIRKYCSQNLIFWIDSSLVPNWAT